MSGSNDSFGIRMGYYDPPMDLPPHEMPDSLRNGLWDICSDLFLSKMYGNSGDLYGAAWDSRYRVFINATWSDFFRKSKDDVPSDPASAREALRKIFFAFDFVLVYSYLEFVIEFCSSYSPGNLEIFVVRCNRILERERAAFRIVGTQFAPITREVELREIEASVIQTSSRGVAEHIQAAIGLYGRRDAPDYRNSIKEAISAVEAAAAIVSGKKEATLGTALTNLRKNGTLHPALADGFWKLYGYTSDAEGIRHALMDVPTLSQADARYMIVSCSAFSNYLLSLSSTNS